MPSIKLPISQTKPVVKRIQLIGFIIIMLGLFSVVIGSSIRMPFIQQNQLAFLSFTLIIGIGCLQIAPLFFPLDIIGSILLESKEVTITKPKKVSIIPTQNIHTIYINIIEYKGQLKDKWWIHKEISPFKNGQKNMIKFIIKGSIYESNFSLKKESEKETTIKQLESFCLEKNIKLIRTNR